MHTFHAFSPDSIEDYEGLYGKEYEAAKERRADAIIDRLERACFPGLRDAIEFREVRQNHFLVNPLLGNFGQFFCSFAVLGVGCVCVVYLGTASIFFTVLHRLAVLWYRAYRL